MKKTIFVLLLMVVIFSTTAFADYCGGFVQCECGDYLIGSQTMWYDLINCPDEGLIIWAASITLDCNNHLIDGIGAYYSGGIFINGQENTVTNCNIQEFYEGIVIGKGSSGNIISYNTVHDNSHSGVLLGEGSDNNILYDNTIINNQGIGIYLVESNNNDIWDNVFVNNGLNALDSGSSNNWNVSDVGNYWDDFPSNPGFPYYYDVPGNGIDWHPIWEDVWITLIPTGITTFPASGGILEYNITGGNYENETVILDVWVDVSVPGWTHPYGPVVGPVMNFNIPSYPWQTNINRELNIPARAPSGIYSLNAYLGEYNVVNPVIYAEDHLNFIKEEV